MFGNNLLGPLISSTKATSGLSLSKILGGAGKTLGFVNKALPLYYQVKPMFNNAKTVLNMYSAMGSDKKENKENIKEEEFILNKEENNKQNIENNKIIVNEVKEENNKIYKNDSLTFFQ